MAKNSYGLSLGNFEVAQFKIYYLLKSLFAFYENLPFPHPKSILIIRIQKPPLISLWIHSQSKGLQVMKIHLMTKELQEKKYN